MDKKEIIEKARLLDFNIKKLQDDAHSDEIKKELEASLAEAAERKIIGTPTLNVGMKQITGAGSYPELVKIITEQGGIRKAE